MADLLALFYLLFSLYTADFNITDPATLKNVIFQSQQIGIEATMKKIEEDYPGLIEKKSPINYEESLKALGYYKNESSDEKLNLRNAILRFKSSYNIPLNDNWDENCASILSYRLLTNSLEYNDTVEAPASKNKWITINKTNRILTLYEGEKVISKYPIAIGNPPSLTPDGKFTVVTRIVNPAWGGGGYAKPVKGGIPANPLGYRWLGLSYKNGGDIGIHGNNSPYSIGKNISHGCIRMINSDVERLFEIVPTSTQVWIGTDEKFKTWGIVQKEFKIEK